MLVHTVLFWLKPDLSETERAAFHAGVDSLKGITAADAVYTGTVSPTPDRPVVDTTYDAMLTVILKDIPAHDAYQADPLHTTFIGENKDKWTRVQIYDAD